MSWYFPTVSEIQKSQFKDRLQILTLIELNRIFDSVKMAIDRHRDDVVSHILDLISYKPDITKLLDKLDDEGFIKHQDCQLATKIDPPLARKIDPPPSFIF